MKLRQTDIIQIKKLKKDRSIDIDSYDRIINLISEGEPVAIPIDYQYGVVAISGNIFEKKICKGLVSKKEAVILISSFKMLEEVAVVSKFQFDFLHRVWPGDVIVRLRKRNPEKQGETIQLLIPKNKYIKDIIRFVNRPLFYYRGFEHGSFFTVDDKKMVKKYKKCINLIIIVEELCKEYSPPSVVDLSSEYLLILYEGKVCSDEIKSLYFLDNE